MVEANASIAEQQHASCSRCASWAGPARTWHEPLTCTCHVETLDDAQSQLRRDDHVVQHDCCPQPHQHCQDIPCEMCKVPAQALVLPGRPLQTQSQQTLHWQHSSGALCSHCTSDMCSTTLEPHCTSAAGRQESRTPEAGATDADSATSPALRSDKLPMHVPSNKASQSRRPCLSPAAHVPQQAAESSWPLCCWGPAARGGCWLLGQPE